MVFGLVNADTCHQKPVLSKRNDDESTYTAVSQGLLRIITKLVMVSLTLALLLSPMLLLFLANLSKSQSALVVILFGIASTRL